MINVWKSLVTFETMEVNNIDNEESIELDKMGVGSQNLN